MDELKLRYVKAPRGPYAENLRHVLKAVNGHLIEGYTADGDVPTEQVTLMPGAIEKADSFLSAHPETNERFDRASELVEGFETPFGLELLATAHWVAAKENAHSDQAIADGFYAWNPGKTQFTPEQVAIAVARLRAGGWIEAEGEPTQAADRA